MAKFRIEETREIIRGYYTNSYEVEADSLEEALEKVENITEDDSDIEYHDQEFDIRDSEHIETTVCEN